MVKENDIVAVKLATGEEIVGKYVGSGHDDLVGPTFKFKQVRVIGMVQTGPNQMGVAMQPYSAADVDGEIAIGQKAIIAKMEVSREMESGYVKQTTNIQLASVGPVPTK